MSCNTCGSTTAGCGCKDTSYTTPTVTTCVPACPPKCAEYISATCVLMQDGIDDIGSKPGDTIESIIQRLTLIITNPLCVDWNPGSGGGGGGGGIIQVGLVAPSNIFETPIVPVTAPGGNLTLTLNDQASNTVFAGPTSGPNDTPQFRALVIDDLPSLTTGTSVLMGDGAGKFANVTIGPNLSFSGGVLDANLNVVIGADNGLTKDPVNTDTVWLGGPSTDPGVLILDTFINTTDQYRLNLYGDNPAVKRGVLEVEHTLNQIAIKAIADLGTAVSANIINGVTAVYASSTGSGIGLTAESDAGTAIAYTSTSKAGIIGDSADENIFTINSTTPPNDSAVSSVLRLTKNYNSASAAGIGSKLDFGFYNSAATDKTSSTIASVTTTVTSGSETADLRFSTIGDGTLETVGEFIGGSGLNNGQFRLNKYGVNTFNVGTALYGLAVDIDGKVMEVALASGLGTVDNGLRLNPALSSEAWLGGTLIDDTTITVPDGILFEIAGDTSTASESVLEINNTAGASGTRALSVSSGGLEPAVHVTQNSTASSSSVKVINNSTNTNAIGVNVETKSLPILAKTTQTANTSQVQLLKLHNQSGGSGGNGIGGYISLNAATVANSDQEVARIGYQFTEAATFTRKGQLEFYTANAAAPAQRMTIKETGQIQFNNYTTTTSFTTTVGASLLGVDTSGNVVNSTGAEGLSFNDLTGNVELGRSALAGASDFSVSRFINAGTNNLVISGNKSSVGATPADIADSAVLRVINTSTTNTTSAIYASIATTANNPSNATIGAAVYALSTGATDDAVAILSRNTSTDFNSCSLKSESSGGIAGRFNTTTQRALVANNTSINATGGLAPIESQKATTSSTNVISVGFQNTRNPSSTPVPAGGGTSYDFSLNAQGTSGISLQTTARMSSYAIDMGITTPGTYASGFKISVQHNGAVPSDRIDFYGANIIKLTQNLPGPYADDTAASGAGVPQYALYRDASSNVKICQI
jgi:hypothetical protein